LPWFRVHLVVLNDPGRLISVHLMHTSLIAGWSSSMLLYELVILDPSDPVYNPIWRQGSYVLPFVNRLGVCTSVFNWYIGIDTKLTSSNSYDSISWNFETVASSHLLLSGVLALSSFWHWAYWDLQVFISSLSGKLVLDLSRVFGIHLLLASLIGFGFGFSHLSGFYGPGFWASDSLGLVGSVRKVKPVYSLIGLTPFCFGVIPSNQVATGLMGVLVGIWHISSRPGPLLYSIFGSFNIEVVLSSSIAAVLFTGLVTSSTMWYGSVTSPLELVGPSRYQWDNGFFSLDIDRRVKGSSYSTATKSRSSSDLLLNWEEVPDKILIYDYIGSNPAKGGLFRSGPMVKGDGILQNWLGHPYFEASTLSLSVRRMPAFFETFPVVLIDKGGSVRADIPFRRAESRYSVEQVNLVVYFYGGLLSKVEFSKPSVVKSFARKSQLGEIFSFEKKTASSDGVFRSSSRGWFSFAHVVLSAKFLLGHLWHSARSLYRDLWTGLSVTSESIASIEYGRNEKLGDARSKSVRW
jgi:photosystem II CP47 chlorophyll apoprotein